MVGDRRYEPSLSSDVLSKGYRGVGSRITDVGTDGFSDEFMHSGENTRSLIRLCRCAPASSPGRRWWIEGDDFLLKA